MLIPKHRHSHFTKSIDIFVCISLVFSLNLSRMQNTVCVIIFFFKRCCCPFTYQKKRGDVLNKFGTIKVLTIYLINLSVCFITYEEKTYIITDENTESTKTNNTKNILKNTEDMLIPKTSVKISVNPF